MKRKVEFEVFSLVKYTNKSTLSYNFSIGQVERKFLLQARTFKEKSRVIKKLGVFSTYRVEKNTRYLDSGFANFVYEI